MGGCGPPYLHGGRRGDAATCSAAARKRRRKAQEPPAGTEPPVKGGDAANTGGGLEVRAGDDRAATLESRTTGIQPADGYDTLELFNSFHFSVEFYEN
ncbi:hypothetical protein llap_4548 [Limosa lapponica baueri]|uniref:Uncharacterized protein n=1 Tax=Limosa lapponica baueri TaxID=1758121 RepID=A0A2I0UGH8_LIMLA|nr:hypothetical protein llap_4548 [Limosa lapponica baueri]